ncbi:hypothetical protein GOBAR_AA05377 [Gossypium barbadense]|uniref:Uncharacterized protein n=1 Tax=Gossypium barbadense TaxID=3634 RepID=A0A2P5YHZ0_GOSBA|nr:hypothetical protein GOBAR_AA05377 [Gossypium barbadense]
MFVITRDLESSRVELSMGETTQQLALTASHDLAALLTFANSLPPTCAGRVKKEEMSGCMSLARKRSREEEKIEVRYVLVSYAVFVKGRKAGGKRELFLK